MVSNFPDEWTQSEYLEAKRAYGIKGIKVFLIDTINNPIMQAETILYNPFEIKTYPKNSILVFYCDTGKSTKERLEEFRKKFPGKTCISLRGGRGYWRRSLTSQNGGSKATADRAH